MQRILFYTGYASLSGFNYGSELALVQLAKQLQKDHDVFILSFHAGPDHLGLKFLSFQEYLEQTFDVIIISRYINFFLYFPVRALKCFIWIHDISFQAAFNGQMLPCNGRYYLENVMYEGVIVQTKWHKDTFEQIYPDAIDRINIIGNGIDTSLYKTPVEKIKYKFIYTSSPTRGLTYLLDIFPKIKEKYPDSLLYIYRDSAEFTQEQLTKIKELKEYVFYKGFANNVSLSREFLSSDVWLYPTNFNETYCISALEAQAAGCLCLCTNMAALSEVVSDRGLLLKSSYGSTEYTNEILNGLSR